MSRVNAYTELLDLAMTGLRQNLVFKFEEKLQVYSGWDVEPYNEFDKFGYKLRCWVSFHDTNHPVYILRIQRLWDSKFNTEDMMDVLFEDLLRDALRVFLSHGGMNMYISTAQLHRDGNNAYFKPQTYFMPLTIKDCVKDET